MADNTIETVSGSKYCYDDPHRHKINLADVAHALSMQCRFGGHMRQFYSVAEHCLNVRENVSDHGPFSRLAALLHDAAEAFVTDLPSPLKHRPGMDAYIAAERGAEDAILDAVYLRAGDRRILRDLIHSAEMKRADIAVTLAERNELLNHDYAHQWEYDSLGITPAVLSYRGNTPDAAAANYRAALQTDLNEIRGRKCNDRQHRNHPHVCLWRAIVCRAPL